MNVGELWREYADNCDTFRDSAARARYARRIEFHWSHLFDRELEAVRSADVRWRRAELIKRNYARTTANWCVALLSSVYRWGQRMDRTTSNPCVGLERLKTDNIAPELFIPDLELHALLDALYSLPESMMIRQVVLIALNTGCRKGEIERAVFADIDWRQKLLRIPCTHAKSRSTRYIPLNASALEVLFFLRRARAAKRQIPTGLLFPGEQNPARPTALISKQWKALQRELGLPHRKFHILRHQYATTALREGQSIAQLQACLGHATPQQTMRYAHMQPGHLADVAGAVDTRTQFHQLGELCNV